jgi:hypothetical protein
MGNMSVEDVDQALQNPRLIFAPDGASFILRVKLNDDARSVDQLFRHDFLRYELIGPDNQFHIWIFNHLLELVPDPDHEDVPRQWTLKAEIALSGWLELTEETVA